MDSVDVCAATSTADTPRASKPSRTNRDWLNRLHLRKTALQPPAMQSPDNPAPKKLAAAPQNTSWLQTSKKRPNHEELQRAIRGNGNSLRFKCSQCTDQTERAPKDLLRHFDEKHKGCLPVFACHMCKFTTHEFSYLQVHILSHKDTFSCCSLCKDDVQRTWAEFSAHLAMVHTRNGRYTCEVCEKFSTADDKDFLEHVLLHNLGLDMKNEQALSKIAAYKCQFCGYEVSQKALLTKHLKTVHGNPDVNNFSTVEPKGKPRMTRSAVKDISWLTQDCLSLPGREFLDKYCHLSDTKTTLEETEQFLMKSGKQRWSKALQNVLSNVPQDTHLPSKPENGITVSVSPDSSQDVLTVKNKLNQNGGSFAKRLKLMTENDLESTDADSCEKFASDTSLSDCLQNQEIKQSSEEFMAESNRENHRLKTHSNKRDVEDVIQDGVVSKELKEGKRKVVRKALPKKKRKNLRWKNMKKKSKKADKSLALKIVLKKNSKTGKQWVTQASKTVFTQSKCNSTIDEKKTCINVDLRRELTKQEKHATMDSEKIQDGGLSIQNGHSVLVKESKEKHIDRREVGAGLGGSAKLKTPPDGSIEASTWAQPVITAHSDTAHPTVSPPHLINRTLEPPPADPSSDPTPPPPPPPAPWPSTPKTQERTLLLSALSPSQLIRRPAGSQPVVVLNHPDADSPEVSRIMKVLNKHKGQVRKVVLSRRTLKVIEGRGREPETPHSAVRERFLLRLKLRRLGKKKFEVVGGEEDGGSRALSCWFCGRVFESRDAWLTHKQRHLLEWKRPNCESS